MGRRGGRWRPSRVSITSVVIVAVFGLVGNLATSTVDVSGWWRAVTWAGVGVLVIAAVATEVVRHRSESDDAESVLGRGEPRPADQGRAGTRFETRARPRTAHAGGLVADNVPTTALVRDNLAAAHELQRGRETDGTASSA